jgi:hypothetical protein
VKARVFLSYARSDGADACNFFQKALQNAGYLVWRDIDDLAGGAPWRQRIEEAIRNVDVVLLFLTDGANASANVKEEWATAIRLQKRIAPLIVTKTQVPTELLPYNYRDITDRRVYELEPSRVQRDVEAERDGLRNDLEQLRSRRDVTVADPNRRKYLDSFFDRLRLALSAEPAGFPPEVLRMLYALLSKLVDELGAARDITPLVEAMAAGTYAQLGWAEGPIYKDRADVVAPILTSVRDALPSITLPVITMAMTQTEASELENGAAFNGFPPEWQQEFDLVRPQLPPGWAQRYAAEAQEWQPFAGEGSIASLIRTEFQNLGNTCQLPLRPSFLDIRKLRQESSRQLLLKLRSTGCLVVIDAISTWHPRVHAAFRASSLDVSLTSLVIRILPEQTPERVRNTVGFLLREWLECEFFQRAYVDLDDRCETVRGPLAFRKWMRNRLKEAVHGCAAPQSEIRPYINNFGG